MKTVLLLVGLVLVIVLVGVIVFLLAKSGKKSTTSSVKKSVKTSQKTADSRLQIDELLEVVINSHSQFDISDSIMAFLNSQTLGPKTTPLSDKDRKILSFISAVCANKKASPSMIAFLSQELSKKYPEFSKEIETYEAIGVAKRKR